MSNLKHPSIRARRNNPKAGFTSLPAGGRKGVAPEWPLPPDVASIAQRDVLLDQVAVAQKDLDDAVDGRAKGRARRSLAKAEREEAILSRGIDEQASLEIELWEMLWTTPQAEIFEDSEAFARMLAQFVRWNIKGELGDIEAAREARIRGKEFGLTPLTLMGLKAEVERADEAEDRGQRRRGRTVPKSSAEPKDDPRGGLYAVS